jgi:hypothetical protein
MGEHDNAGFPLSYCLLSTATAIDQGKRKKALSAWSQCVRDKYSLFPVFIHTDKDMGEIGSSKTVWDAKINLCWWHLRRAVRTRLAKAKLSTTPYNVDRAIKEFGFISTDFIPAGMRVDIEDYEGGLPEKDLPPLVDVNQAPLSNSLRVKFSLPNIVSAVGRVIHGTGFRLHIPAVMVMQLPTINEEEEETVEKANEGISDNEGSEEDDRNPERRTFCPAIYRDTIINMMERHYCAHPLIPGYGPPDAVGIKKWAVQQIYNFCLKHDLCEVWVYLWENWYRRGRWELWARSEHKLMLNCQSLTRSSDHMIIVDDHVTSSHTI